MVCDICRICVNSDSVESYISRNAKRKYACQKKKMRSIHTPPPLRSVTVRYGRSFVRGRTNRLIKGQGMVGGGGGGGGFITNTLLSIFNKQ
jgi:hypothetical protein